MTKMFNAHGAPKSQSTGVPGWETIAEEKALIKLAKAVPENGIIVEIGGEWGRSASQFAKHAAKGVQIYTVDLFPDDYHGMKHGLLHMHRHNLKLAGLLHRTTQIQGRSDLMASSWQSDIDLLFIDGGHGYKQVLLDIQGWVRFVKDGGVVAFHDYAKSKASHYLHHQVKMAVDEWYIDGTKYDPVHPEIGQWKRTNGPDSLVWFDKLYSLDKIMDEAEEIVMATNIETVELVANDEIPFGDLGDNWISEDFEHYSEHATIDELKAYGESHGLKMGRYSKRESIIKKLKAEGLL